MGGSPQSTRRNIKEKQNADTDKIQAGLSIEKNNDIICRNLAQTPRETNTFQKTSRRCKNKEREKQPSGKPKNK